MDSTTFTEEQKQKIQQRMQTGTPRFLFRSWHDESGGSGEHNTIEGVTPRRFREIPSHSRDLFDNDVQDLIETAAAHLHTVSQMPKHTVFSSWTHSLPQAFSWTRLHFAQGYRNLHMCILDTKQLPSTQVVLHTHAMHELISTKIPDNFEHEFLVYGPIEGPAYKAVSVDSIHKVDLDKFYPGVREDDFDPPQGKDFAKEGEAEALLSAASNIGQSFGEYSLPVQAHLLACVTHSDSNHLSTVDALSHLEIPEDWLDEPDPTDLDVAGHTEAQRAALVLRDLARRGHRNSVGESTSDERKALRDHATRRAKMLEAKAKDIPQDVGGTSLKGPREKRVWFV